MTLRAGMSSSMSKSILVAMPHLLSFTVMIERKERMREEYEGGGEREREKRARKKERE